MEEVKNEIVNEPTVLDPIDAAVVFRESGDIEALIPNMDDSAVVPAHILNAVVVLELLHDEEFQALFTAKFNEMFKRDPEDTEE